MDDKEKRLTPVRRDRVIIRTSIVGIAANFLLSTFKAVIGVLTNSIAITLDAVNNLSDALSSIITIVGTKLAGKKPDKKHPLGHGRVEYLGAMIVSGIVLYAGITSIIESIKKIINPEKADYSVLSLVIISVAVVVKILLGTYVKKKGEEVNSNSLIASGVDAMLDSIVSASVLASAIIFLLTGISLEAYVGLVIGVIIIKSGVEIMKDTIDEILGKRPDPELAKRVKSLIAEEPDVRGAYDLIINNYGPDRNYATVHIEVPDTMTANELDILTRKLEYKVYMEMGISLAAVGVYAYNTNNDEAAHIREKVCSKILSHEWALQVHGFYIDMERKEMRFDVVFSFKIPAKEGLEIVRADMKELYPDYDFVIVPDVDLSE